MGGRSEGKFQVEYPGKTPFRTGGEDPCDILVTAFRKEGLQNDGSSGRCLEERPFRPDFAPR